MKASLTIETSQPKPAIKKLDGGILSLSGTALLDLLRAVLDKGVPFRFLARGISMSPFIKDSDVITVSPCGCNAIRFGDIVAFVNPSNERLTVHRVIGISQVACLIRGDNTLEPDGWIPIPNILGRVTHIERLSQRVQLGLNIERNIIAFLSRRGWLAPLLVPFRYIYHLLFKRLTV